MQFLGSIETYLFSSSNPGRCSDNTFIKTCSLYQDLLVTLDNLCSKLYMKHGEPKKEDYKVGERSLENYEYLWRLENLSNIPKIHGLPFHAINWMQYFEGIRGAIENDI
jgi:hypothetical protein